MSVYAEQEMRTSETGSSRSERHWGGASSGGSSTDDDPASPASPTRRLVEDAVAKASSARSEADLLRRDLEEARTEAARGRAAVAENDALRRALNNLNASFEEQERQMQASLASSDDELRRLQDEKHRYARLSEKMLASSSRQPF